MTQHTRIYKFFLCILLIFLIIQSVCVSQDAPLYKVQRVVLDAGHGGVDPGASGRFTKEKNIALAVTLKLGKIIKEHMPDVQVFYTRTDDTYLSLHERATFANKKQADLFISIHCNWISNSAIYGTETYVMGLHKSEENFEVAKRENSVILLDEDTTNIYQGFDPSRPESYILFNIYQNAYHENSLNFAAKIENQFKTRVNKYSRGVKTAGFWVLWETSMPSVLIETGYLSNRKEERVLSNVLQQNYIASAIYRAFKDYKKEVERK